MMYLGCVGALVRLTCAVVSSGAIYWTKTVEKYACCRRYCWKMVSCTQRAADVNASSAGRTLVSD